MNPITIAITFAVLATLGFFAAMFMRRQLDRIINELNEITLPAM